MKEMFLFMLLLSCMNLVKSFTIFQSINTVPHRLNINMAGFGASSSAKTKAGLNDKAKKLLKASQGDLNQAQSMFFKDRIEELLTSKDGNINSDNELMHEMMVEATWDTIASYLPLGGEDVDIEVKQKFNAIAKSCVNNNDNNSGNSRFRILDVGCGDGALLPYLNSQLASSSMDYYGIDVSSIMIDTANQKYLKKKKSKKNKTDNSNIIEFHKGNFINHKLVETDQLNNDYYDCIIFNGSLQFFRLFKPVIQRALNVLKPNGRIVISHANGAAFVRNEKQGSPNVVLSEMPSVDQLQGLVNDINLKVMNMKDMNIDNNDIVVDLEEFYLLGLRRNE